MTTKSELIEFQQTAYISKNPTRRWLHCTRRNWIINKIQAIVANKQLNRVLEVGPGSGIYLPILAELFEEVTTSDVEYAYLENASHLREMYSNLSLIVDDITDTKLPEASFDLILCTEVIEHIADSTSAIAGMHRVLKPGGILILSTPQRWSPLELIAKIAFMPGIIDLVRLIYKEPILETGHINLMTSEQVVRQLKSVGFHICERFKSGMYLPFIAEFGGKIGLNFEQWLESKIINGSID